MAEWQDGRIHAVNCYMLHVTFYFLNTDKLRDLCFGMVAYGVEGDEMEMILYIIFILYIYNINIIYH